MSGNLLFSVFGEVCESLCRGWGELSALPVRPALNVFSHSLDYPLNFLFMQQSSGAKQQNIFFVSLEAVCC